MNWIRNISLGAIATVACFAGANSAWADHYYHGNNHGCSPNAGYSNYGYRPVVILPYYGTNYGVGGFSTNYNGYSSNYGGYNNFYGGYNNFRGGYGVGGYPMGSSYGGGAFPSGGSYGGGAFPSGGSYGGGAFPSGGSYGGGAFPRGGSYGGGGFSLNTGR